MYGQTCALRSAALALCIYNINNKSNFLNLGRGKWQFVIVNTSMYSDSTNSTAQLNESYNIGAISQITPHRA